MSSDSQLIPSIDGREIQNQEDEDAVVDLDAAAEAAARLAGQQGPEGLKKPSLAFRLTISCVSSLAVIFLAGVLLQTVQPSASRRRAVGAARNGTTDVQNQSRQNASRQQARDREPDVNETRLAFVMGRDGEGNASWVRGREGENCTAACARANMVCEILDESWPESSDNVTEIATKLGLSCKNFTVAENVYDPSVSGTFCSHGPFKLKAMWKDFRPASVRSCEAIPPFATKRLCPCVEHKKHLDCETCSPTCWQRQACCPANQDPCAADPVAPNAPRDPRWWGSGPDQPATGVDPDAWCQRGHPDVFRVPEMTPYTGEEVSADAPDVRVKVLTYNLYWWKLFRMQNGNWGSAGKLIADAGASEPFDLMAFQECENPGWVLGDAGMENTFSFFQGPNAVCMAYRKSEWTLLDNGDHQVAEDGNWVRGSYYGKRIMMWLRLRHVPSGRTVFFANHHGPLPVNSGGRCGGLATAHNVLQVIQDKANKTDAVILVGDFNAGPYSPTVQMIGSQLAQVYNGTKFGGVDNFLTNVDQQRVIERHNYGGGGSDHDALGLIVNLTTTITPTARLTQSAAELLMGARELLLPQSARELLNGARDMFLDT